MRIGKAAVGTIAVLITAAPQALSVEGTPLRATTGVVITWNAKARASVVTTGGRVMVIHSLRRYRTGTRVRIRGIKWGRVGLGIKWGLRPRGIKWGIMQARNGTYIAGLRSIGYTNKMKFRGTVVRRYRGGVGISVRGATFTLRSNPGAWSAGTQTMAVGVGDVGARVQFDLRVSATGAPIVTQASEIIPASPGASVPYAGTVAAVDPVAGTIVVDATSDPAFPLTFTLTVPVGVDIAKIKRGARISGSAKTSPTGGPELFATAISDNSTFAGADNPATTVEIPAPDVPMLVAAHNLRTAWEQAGADGKFTPDGVDLFTVCGHQLAGVERAIMRNDLPRALDKLTRVVIAVQTANLPAGSPVKVDPTWQAAFVAEAQALQSRLAGKVLESGGGAGGGGGTPPDGGTGPGEGQGAGGGSGAGSGGTDPDKVTGNGGGSAGNANGGGKPNGTGSTSAGTGNDNPNGNNGADGNGGVNACNSNAGGNGVGNAYGLVDGNGVGNAYGLGNGANQAKSLAGVESSAVAGVVGTCNR